MAASRSLITGGAAFIGSHLAEELLREGQEVCIVDNLSTGSIGNIEHLTQREVTFGAVSDWILRKLRRSC